MDTVDEIKDRLSIEDVISEYLPLKRSGRNYKALSPFTNEKTPSFIVSPEKQIWKDFSSGKGGSIFDFIMEVEGLDFKESLELLAKKAGVDLEPSQGARSSVNKDRLYDILDLSTKFYQVQLTKSRLALDYILNQRKFTKPTVLTWRLGYSPNTGSALINYLKKQGFSERDIKLSGLSANSYRGGLSDMFRGRLMIPLQDQAGRVIGFTARILDSNPNAPKYINTPQTPLYDKSHHIYGLHLAKTAIRKDDFAVIVEGNLDVIASHQAGVDQAVATAGTALTEAQLKILSRFTDDVRACFDADQAGLAATERTIPLASKVKLSLSIINLPSGKDPDELVRQSPKLWQKAVRQNAYALDWLIDHYAKLLDLSTGKGARDFSDKIVPVINQLADPVEQDHYLSEVADLIKVDKQALIKKMSDEAKPRSRPKRPIKVAVQPPSIDADSIKLQDRFVSLLLMRQTLREFTDHVLRPAMLPTKDGQLLMKWLNDHPDYSFSDGEDLKDLAEYGKIEELVYKELYQGLELNELHDEAERLETELVTKFVKTEKAKIRIQLVATASQSELRLLQEKDKRLNDLLRQVKGVNHG